MEQRGVLTFKLFYHMMSTIVKFWEMTGICNVVENRDVVGIGLDPTRITLDGGEEATPAALQGGYALPQRSVCE